MSPRGSERPAIDVGDNRECRLLRARGEWPALGVD
jgi:hypothetical protein